MVLQESKNMKIKAKISSIGKASIQSRWTFISWVRMSNNEKLLEGLCDMMSFMAKI